MGRWSLSIDDHYSITMEMIIVDDLEMNNNNDNNNNNCAMFLWTISKLFINTEYLVGGLEHGFYFPYIGKNNPKWLSYFSEGLKPPTSHWYGWFGGNPISGNHHMYSWWLIIIVLYIYVFE